MDGSTDTVVDGGQPDVVVDPICPEGWTGADCSVCVFYVNQNGGADDANGRTWATPFRDLQMAVDHAGREAPKCVVWVATGTFVPYFRPIANLSANGATLYLPAGVSVYGGFAGVEHSLGARDIERNPTTITGEIGTPDVADNLYWVITAADVGKITLDGLTVTRAFGDALHIVNNSDVTVSRCTFTGNTEGSAIGFRDRAVATVLDSTFIGNSGNSGNGGAAISGACTNLAVRRSTFINNQGREQGGAIHCVIGPVQISDSVFTGNVVVRTNAIPSGLPESSGGGALNIVSSPAAVVERCTFTSNRAVGQTNGDVGVGGAINGTNVVVRDSVFDENYADTVGGAIMARSVTVERSQFRNNQSTLEGGAILGSNFGVSASEFIGNAANMGGALAGRYVSATASEFSGNSATKGGAIACTWNCWITNSIFDSNSASGGPGGAIYGDVPFLEVAGSLFSGNTAMGNGGAIECLAPFEQMILHTARITNSTFFGNAATGVGAAIHNACPATIVNNSILWGDRADAAGGEIFSEQSLSSLLIIHTSDVQGSGFDGADGNFDLSPDFGSTVPGGLDLRLRLGSPCIDAGLNGSVPRNLQVDLDGNPRIINGVVDLGAYELLQ